MARIHLTLSYFLILFGYPIFAQTGAITGQVKSDTGISIGFASITAIGPGNTIITGTVTDTEGKFSIKTPEEGRYILRITAEGYIALETDSFDISGPDVSKDMGNIILKPDVTQIEAVKVESMRPVITQEADKMVVKVEGTAMAAGNTAFAVLSRMPGVFIDPEGNIRLNGRSGVTVMLDGKLTYLSAADLRNMLEGMAAENLKSIEIITNPSAKYDAEGTSGILNINLKKNTRSGVNGSIYTGYTYNFKQHGYTYGSNVNYKSGKWNTFISADGARRVGGREATFTRVFYAPDATTYFDQVAEGNYENEGPPSLRGGLDYSINDKHEIGVMGSFTRNTGNQEFLTDTYIGSSPNNPSQYINADNFSENTYSNYKVNVHYTTKLDTIGTVFSSDLDYVKVTNRGHSNFYNYFTDFDADTQTQDFLYSETPNQFDIYSAKADFIKPYRSDRKIEAGLKASRVNSDADSRFYFNNDGLVNDPLRSNHFLYEESIYAGYLSWNTPLGKRFSLKAGLRAENTVSTGNSVTTGQVTDRNYLDLFPSLFLQQKVTDNYEINYSYSRRITRPNYGSLNPFIAYRDPYTWWMGNPYLRPTYTHSISIAQAFKQTYHLTLSYDYEKDVMSEIPILDVENATTIYTIGNIDHGQTIDLTGLAPVKIAKWWDTQNTIVLSYTELETKSDNGNLANNQLFFMLQSNHTIKLPEDIKMELNIQYQGPAANGLYTMAPMSRVDIAFKKSIFKKKLDVVLRGNDLFKGYRYYWTTNINNNVNEFDQYFRIRNVGISLRYNFSKGLKTEAARNTNVEELNRI